MKAEIRVTSNFSKRAKSLIKKYPSLINELEALEKTLTDNPQLGTPLGIDTYKIRLSIKSKGKGKFTFLPSTTSLRLHPYQPKN